MYSKFAISPLVEIRPVITKRVTFRFRAIRPTLTPDVIYCNPFRIISRLSLFSQLGGATLTTTTPPTPTQADKKRFFWLPAKLFLANFHFKPLYLPGWVFYPFKQNNRNTGLKTGKNKNGVATLGYNPLLRLLYVFPIITLMFFHTPFTTSDY